MKLIDLFENDVMIKLIGNSASWLKYFMFIFLEGCTVTVSFPNAWADGPTKGIQKISPGSYVMQIGKTQHERVSFDSDDAEVKQGMFSPYEVGRVTIHNANKDVIIKNILTRFKHHLEQGEPGVLIPAIDALHEAYGWPELLVIKKTIEGHHEAE